MDSADQTDLDPEKVNPYKPPPPEVNHELPSLFSNKDFSSLLVVLASTTLASRALAVVIGYQVYRITGNTYSLGILGLVEAIPALSLALYGGHIADHYDRRTILRYTLGVLVVCGAMFAIVSAVSHEGPSVWALYTIVFVAGIARGFAEPAANALEAQVVPANQLMIAVTWFGAAWLGSGIIGPVLGGIGLDTVGAPASYGLIAGSFFIAWLAVTNITPQPAPKHTADVSIWESIAIGVRYVTNDQVLLWSMALDLFAVLFGGAIALLPVFAKDILQVGPIGLGFLNASPQAGALLTMLIATQFPPQKNAGRILLSAVFCFGICMIVFALSQSLWLSLVALFLSGVCDGVSVVVRRAIVRLMSPMHLRGRIAAVSMVFIGSSNEIGAFESGVAAGLLGTQRSVWFGGVVTLLVVAATTALAPRLRALDLTGKRPPDAAPEPGDEALENKAI